MKATAPAFTVQRPSKSGHTVVNQTIGANTDTNHTSYMVLYIFRASSITPATPSARRNYKNHTESLFFF